jgi:RIO kinase 1
MDYKKISIKKRENYINKTVLFFVMGKFQEKFKTYQHVFDDFTNRTLYQLITQGHFDGLIGPISTGKEANVFVCRKGDQKVCVKIYRLETCDFNRMYDYIKDDPRFSGLKRHKRKVIFAWAQREYRNLLIAREGQVRVPTPLTFLNNVLVMEFIGDKEAAPKLKDAHPDNLEEFFKDTMNNIKKLYDAGLVHGDLSQFNILNFQEKPFLIDLSHATPIKNYNSIELMQRDLTNVSNFFRKLGLPEKLIQKGVKSIKFKSE